MDENELNLQDQLDSNLGYDYNSDLGDNSLQGAEYLGNQTDWNFGNYNQPSQPSYGGMYDMPQYSGSGTTGGMDMAPQEWFNQQPIQMSPQEMQASGQMPSETNFNPNSGGIQSFLSQLFGSNGTMNSSGSKALLTGLGALMEGRQNKQQSRTMQQLVQQQQQQASPYDRASAGASAMGASSMRDAMQQKLAAAMQDPYSAPIVQSQVEQIRRAQAIKDAAAGRRSNSATSDPAMLAAQAKVAQDYINSLQGPAGAGVGPSSGGLQQLLESAKYDTNGYTSPIMSALGYNSQTNNNTAQIDALRKLLTGAR